MIIVQTPLRISFFGGGTDFPDFYKEHGGAVLSTAIDKYIYVIVKPRLDSKVRVTYTEAELVEDSIQLKHEIIRECLKRFHIYHGIEIITIGDIAGGTGLGSSSSVTVGVLKALYTYTGREVNAKELAKEACTVEIDILKKPIGIQDQYIASYGGGKFFEFNPIGDPKSTNINLSGVFDKLLFFDTGLTHNANEILSVQNKNTEVNVPVLNEMAVMAVKGKEYLLKGDYEKFGMLLNETWILKRNLAVGISNEKIDEWYESATAAGAIGGKLLGAGGGGFLMFYCPEGTKDAVRQALSDLTEMPISIEPDGSKVLLNYRT